jgi:virulence-associated protein VagC
LPGFFIFRRNGAVRIPGLLVFPGDAVRI